MLTETRLRKNVETLVTAYAGATQLSVGTISLVVFNDNKTIRRMLNAGAGVSFRVNTYDRLLVHLAKNWPDGLKWPSGIERPTAADILLVESAVKPSAAAE